VNFIGKVEASAREVWREKIFLFIALFIVVATIAVFSFSNTFESRNAFDQDHNLHPPARTESLFWDVKLPIAVFLILDTLFLWATNSAVFFLNRTLAIMLVSPLIFFYQYIVKMPAIPHLGMEISLFLKASATAFSAHATLRMLALVVYSVIELTMDLFWKVVCTKEVIVTIRKYRKFSTKVLIEYSGNSHLKKMYWCCILLLFFCAVLESLCAHVL